ncbi:unnamed protein product [Amoebophrya sp. A25]|nr:unnamed protein product [Amoebophrya sp. A25]|eukprot:GSA25T00007397001.1
MKDEMKTDNNNDKDTCPLSAFEWIADNEAFVDTLKWCWREYQHEDGERERIAKVVLCETCQLFNATSTESRDCLMDDSRPEDGRTLKTVSVSPVMFVPGCGTSDIWKLSLRCDQCEKPLYRIFGADVDESAINEAKERYERLQVQTRPNEGSSSHVEETLEQLHVSWECVDLGTKTIETTPAPADRSWLTFDKGTLDYFLCGEVETMATYLLDHVARRTRSQSQTDHENGSGGGFYFYVLISFRNPEFLKRIVEATRCFRMVTKRDGETESEGSQESSSKEATTNSYYTLVFKREHDLEDTVKSDACAHAALQERLRQIVDEYYRAKGRTANYSLSPASSLIIPPNDESTPVSLEAAYKICVSSDLQSEYPMSLFLEDLKATNPEAFRKGRMSRKDMMNFLEENM